MATLDELTDRIAIAELKARYCRLLDTKDWDGFAALLTEDFELDVSGGSAMPVIHGRAEAIAMTRAAIGGARTAHQVHQPEIALHGDSATAIWPMQDRVVWTAESPSRGGMAALTGYGHYHERYVRIDGAWRIAASRLTRLHIDIEPLTGG